jgi:hypothetical protein
MGYVIRFTGKISWEGQANGLPPEIYAFLIFTEYEQEKFNAAIENQCGQFIYHRGMAVQRDQGALIDLRQMPQDRMWVPMDWIVSITPSVHNLTGELPIADHEGVERLEDGTEPIKQ